MRANVFSSVWEAYQMTFNWLALTKAYHKTAFTPKALSILPANEIGYQQREGQ
jgi:hypothetical protein